MKDRIVVSDTIYLDQINESDAHDLLECIGCKEVQENLLLVPYPYRLSDAISWIRHVEDQKQKYGHLVNWTIRLNNQLIGGIGLHKKYPHQPHKDEIGYWLGKNYWNQGYLTRVLSAFIKYCVAEHDLVRFEAPVFVANKGSQKVLKKNDFINEGLMKKAFYKEGMYKDAFLYARVIE